MAMLNNQRVHVYIYRCVLWRSVKGIGAVSSTEKKRSMIAKFESMVPSQLTPSFGWASQIEVVHRPHWTACTTHTYRVFNSWNLTHVSPSTSKNFLEIVQLGNQNINPCIAFFTAKSTGKKTRSTCCFKLHLGPVWRDGLINPMFYYVPWLAQFKALVYTGINWFLFISVI
jgi:hypothetical protein